MRHQFQAEQWVPWSVERVFAFFADPANLPVLMPGWQHTRIENMHLMPPPASAERSIAGVVAGEGSRICVSFRPVPLLPFRLSWEAHIVEFGWNEYFCDEQAKGPFRSFRHCHRIREAERDAEPGCVVSDKVDYELPMGLVGEWAHRFVVKHQIAALFAHRQRRLLQVLAERDDPQAMAR